MKKLVMFVLILLALMVVAAFLVVMWLRAEDAKDRAESRTALQVEELRKSEEARGRSQVEVQQVGPRVE